MDKGILQRYSTWAKENLENQIEVSLKGSYILSCRSLWEKTEYH